MAKVVSLSDGDDMLPVYDEEEEDGPQAAMDEDIDALFDGEDDDDAGDPGAEKLFDTLTEKDKCAAMASHLRSNHQNQQQQQQPVPSLPSSSSSSSSGESMDDEKQPVAAAAASQKKRPLPQAAPLPPPPEKKKSKKKKTAVAPEVPGKAHLPIFPHADDQRRVCQYIRVMTFSLIKTGEIGNLGDDATDEQNAAMTDGRAFFRRCIMFRRQFLDALKERAVANPYMSALLPAFAVCKLVMFNSSKPLFPAKGEGEEPEKAFCVWSRREILPSNVKAVALVPLESSFSHTAGNKQAEPVLAPVMFHVDLLYVNALKCIHTLLFYLDYLTAEINSKVDAVRSSIAATDPEEIWAEMLAKQDKKDPLVSMCTSAQTQLVECVKAFKTVIDEKHLVVKTKKE